MLKCSWINSRKPMSLIPHLTSGKTLSVNCSGKDLIRYQVGGHIANTSNTTITSI